MTFPCIKCKIHKYTITQVRKYTNTKYLKDPTCATFLKTWDSRISNITFPCMKCKTHNLLFKLYRFCIGHLLVLSAASHALVESESEAIGQIEIFSDC